jgi:hypothetical protein
MNKQGEVVLTMSRQEAERWIKKQPCFTRRIRQEVALVLGLDCGPKETE